MPQKTPTRRKRQLKLHVGIVLHEHGSNAYVATTEAELYSKVSNYVREWVEDCGDEDDQAELQRLLDAKQWQPAVEFYFERVTASESLEVGEDTITI